MTNAMKRNPRGGDAPRVLLYTLGIIVALMAAVLVKTTTIDNSGLSKSANLTGYNPLTVAPIANQVGNTGLPVYPVSPTATDSQSSPFPVIRWTATGLPPGVTISRTSGLITGTPTISGTYQVTVTAKDNAHPPTYGSTSFNWYVGNMAPTITQVVPVESQGVGGIHVVITGTDFLQVTSVTFGGVNAGSFSVSRGHTRITAYAPPERAGTVDVQVTSIGGTSAPVPADQFTYLPPQISLVATATGTTAGGTRVRIIGTGLGGASSVTFGGVTSPYFVVRRSGTLISAVAPASYAHSVTIRVITPGGTADSGSRAFTYQVPPPPPVRTHTTRSRHHT
jgi:hypothetical protein